MTAADSMSVIAANKSTQLLWDQGETQRFYSYNIVTNALTLLSDHDAKNFYNNSTSWQLPGSCCFGSTNVNINLKALQAAPVITVLTSDDQANILTDETGSIDLVANE